MIELQNKAMIITLNICQWSMRKYDKKVSDEIDYQYNANHAGRFNKILMDQDERSKLIFQTANSARTFHYFNTLAWDDNNGRILPSLNYLPYITKMSELKNLYFIYTEDFFQIYPSLKEAQKLRLNGLYKEEDYPSLENLRNKYRFDVKVSPLPVAEDFRVQLNQEEVEKIKKDIESRMFDSQANAMKDLWGRLHEAIKHIVNRLSDKDAIFRDSLIGNVVELVQILPKLNIANDQNLEGMRIEVEKNICSLNPEGIRKNATLRKETAKKAEDLLDKMKGYM